MQTKKFTIEFPSDILSLLNENELEFKNDLKLSLAIHLFNLNKISIGKAAEIANISKYEFENELAIIGYPVSHLTLVDVENDLIQLK